MLMIDLEVPRMNNSRSTYPCHAIRSLFSSFTQLIPTQHCQKSGRLKQPVWNGPSQRDSDLSAIVRKKGQKANGYLFKASKDLDSFLPLENIALTKKVKPFPLLGKDWLTAAHVGEPLWIEELDAFLL